MTPQSTSGSDLDAILGLSIIVMVILSVIIARIVILRGVPRLMRARSDEVESDEIPGRDIREHKASHKPRLVEVTADTDLGSVARTREGNVQRALRTFRQAYLIGTLACLGYILIPWLFSAMAGYSPTPELHWVAITLAVSYFVLILSARYLSYRKQFRAEDARGVAYRIIRSWVAWDTLLSPRVEGYVAGSFIALMVLFALAGLTPSTSSPDLSLHYPAVAIGMLIAAALHIGMRVAFWLRIQQGQNLKLVVLRVFGLDKTARFTFGGILRFWEHFGSYFTVVDPSFMKHGFRFWSFKSLFTMVGVAVLWLIGMVLVSLMIGGNDQELDRFFNMAAIPMGIITLGLYSGAFYWRVRRSFARSELDIRSRIGRLLKRPRNVSLSFKALPLACFDNTWRLAVKEFVTLGDVVLMDLRGFSNERKGCEYEVDFLFDNTSINQVVFLVDSQSDRDAVEKLILDRWEYLRANSPNRDEADPVALVYVSAEEKKQDIQALVDILLSVASKKSRLSLHDCTVSPASAAGAGVGRS